MRQSRVLMVLSILLWCRPAIAISQSENHDIRCLSIAKSAGMLEPWLKEKYNVLMQDQVLTTAKNVSKNYMNNILTKMEDSEQNDAIDSSISLAKEEAVEALKSFLRVASNGNISKNAIDCVIQSYYYRRYSNENCEFSETLSECDEAQYLFPIRNFCDNYAGYLKDKPFSLMDKEGLHPGPQLDFLCKNYSNFKGARGKMSDLLSVEKSTSNNKNISWDIKANDVGGCTSDTRMTLSSDGFSVNLNTNITCPKSQEQLAIEEQARRNTSSCYSQCNSLKYTCQSQCAGLSDTNPNWATSSPRTNCEVSCMTAKDECDKGCR